MVDSGLVVTSLTFFSLCSTTAFLGGRWENIVSELPDPDRRTRQLIKLCAARASLTAPREGKDRTIGQR